MTEPMPPEQEAAALWGSATNPTYPLEDRLAFALQALEFFGNEVDRLARVAQDAQSDAVIERAARAIAERQYLTMHWDEIPSLHHHYRDDARAALGAAFQQGQAEGDRG